MKQAHKLAALSLTGLGVVASLLSVGFADPAPIQIENTEVYLTITGGELSIGVTGTLDLGTVVIRSVDYTTGATFTPPVGAGTGEGYFWVEDLDGSDTGWHTDVQISDLIGTADPVNHVIDSDNIEIKINNLTPELIAGNANTRVELATAWSNYRIASNPLTMIKRDAGANNGTLGRYGVLPSVQVTIPAYQAVDEYVATVTYTLYEGPHS